LQNPGAEGVRVFKRLRADLREMVQEQFEYWELLYVMSRRDLMLRYKQTIMGFGWAVFMPVLNTILFSVVFAKVATLDVGVPYPVFAYTGLLAWNLTASALRFSVSSLTANINLVAKVYFPREIFPFSAVFVSAVDYAVGAIILIALLLYYQVPVTATVLFLPVILLVQLTFTAAVALFLAMANLFYRDVKYLFEVVIMLWMFASSVVYPLDNVTGLAGKILALNPMTPILNAYRDVILFGRMPPLPEFAAVAGVSVVMLAVAWVMFHRSEYRFAELL
jgi:lipopolysaccharide transport system permease protein